MSEFAKKHPALVEAFGLAATTVVMGAIYIRSPDAALAIVGLATAVLIAGEAYSRTAREQEAHKGDAAKPAVLQLN